MLPRQYSFGFYYIRIILAVVTITIVGIIAVGSAGGADLQQKQLIGFCVGLFAMILLSFFEYNIFLKLYIPIYALNLMLLLLVKFIGDDAGGATRWVIIAGIRFQPSEFAKVLLILFFAKFIHKFSSKLSNLSMIAVLLALFAAPWILVYKQPDMSTSIMLLIIFAGLVFAGGISWKYIAGVLAVIIPAGIILFTIVLQPDQKLIEKYQQTRILAWLRPENYTIDEAFQQLNSIMAIGSGQLMGKGLNNNEVASVNKGNFISQPQTDFIFAVIGEEFGFIGGTAVIGLLLWISLECFALAIKARDLAGSLICVGMGTWISVQGMVNIGVTTGLLPNTGLTLPFVSAGLTSLIALYIGMGFVLSVGMQSGRSVGLRR